MLLYIYINRLLLTAYTTLHDQCVYVYARASLQHLLWSIHSYNILISVLGSSVFLCFEYVPQVSQPRMPWLPVSVLKNSVKCEWIACTEGTAVTLNSCYQVKRCRFPLLQPWNIAFIECSHRMQWGVLLWPLLGTLLCLCFHEWTASAWSHATLLVHIHNVWPVYTV